MKINQTTFLGSRLVIKMFGDDFMYIDNLWECFINTSDNDINKIDVEYKNKSHNITYT